jgi:hypothetical protein
VFWAVSTAWCSWRAAAAASSRQPAAAVIAGEHHHRHHEAGDRCSEMLEKRRHRMSALAHCYIFWVLLITGYSIGRSAKN